MTLPRLSDVGRMLRNLRRRRRTIVLPNNEEIEFVGATPENERYQPGFIVLEREAPVASGQVSMGFDIGADGTPVIAHVSFDYPRTPEQEAVDEGIRLQNEMLQEQLNQVCVNTLEFIGNAWTSVGGVKVKPIDRLYPHHCQNKKCARQLKFEELLFAEANRKLKSSFINKVFEHLSEKYSQFTYNVRADWSDVIGRFEYRQYLRKLWKNPRVQFYCCACFQKATLTDVHDAFDTTERDYLEELRDDEEYQHFVNQLQEDLLEGTGLTREQLLGSEENDQIQEWIGVHPINRQAVAENPNIMVYGFTRGYNCPNCLRRLQLNEFHNWECSHCHEQSLRGTGLHDSIYTQYLEHLRRSR